MSGAIRPTDRPRVGADGTGIDTARKRPRYAVISAVRNEEDYIAQTAEALVAQTLGPSAWLVVDDGSTDRTSGIVRAYAQRHPWIRGLALGELGGSNRCSRVMRAFLTGYASLDGEFDYVLKVDGDVTFDPDHIERLLAHFDKDPQLGIASGICAEPAGRGWRVTTRPEGYAVGALRAYRAECLRRVVESITPSIATQGTCGQETQGAHDSRVTLSWDSIDHLYAAALGWKTVCFPDLVFVHHRTEGARSHVLRGLFEQGVVSYVMGYHPAYAFARGLYRTVEYPYVVGGLALTLGYLLAAANRDVVRADERTRSLVRDQQIRRVRRALGLEGAHAVSNDRRGSAS